MTSPWLYAFPAHDAPAPPDPHSWSTVGTATVRDVVLTRWCDPSGLVGATVSGSVTPDDQYELVTLVRDAVARFGQVDVLIWLEHYAGCRHDARFDPDGLWGETDAKGIARIAIIGEPAWKIVAPRRRSRRHVPIEYFSTEQAARRWLAGPRARRQALRANDRRRLEPSSSEVIP
jgi:hypothetical protein